MRVCSRALLTATLAAFAVAAGSAARGDGAAAALDAAKRAYEASEYEKGVEALRLTAAGEPDNAEVQFWLLRNYFELDQWDAAISAGERAVAIAQGSSEYHMWLGRSYGSKAEVAGWWKAFALAKKSRREFETAVTLDPKNFAATQDLIEFYCAAPGVVGGGEDKALRLINDLMNVEEGEARFGRGNCFKLKKNFDQADAEFDRAIAAGLKRTATIYEVGDYAAKHNQAERMLKVAESGRKVDPTDPRAEFYRGAALVMKNERLGEAERLLKSYLKRAPVRTAYPSPAWAHAFLGRLYEQQGRCDPATAEYREVLRTDPKNKEARDALKRLAKQC